MYAIAPHQVIFVISLRLDVLTLNVVGHHRLSAKVLALSISYISRPCLLLTKVLLHDTCIQMCISICVGV